MKKLFLSISIMIFLLFPVANSYAQDNYWYFLANDTNWKTNKPTVFGFKDTSFIDSEFNVSGVYRFGATVGDPAYAKVDLRQYGINMASRPEFFFSTTFYMSQIDLYSMIFMGITDSEAATPIDYSWYTGVMIGIGRNYDGYVFGIYAGNGTNYVFKDTVNSALFSENKVYGLDVYASYGYFSAYLYRMSDYHQMAYLSLPYNQNDYKDKGLNYWAVTNKGYVSSNGNGFATINGGLDYLNVGLANGSTNIKENSISLAEKFSINASPNPFTDRVRLVIGFPESDMLHPQHQITIFNSQGRIVANLSSSLMDKSRLTASWDASSQPNGIYFVRCTVNGKVLTKAIYRVK